ncbi:hypothetical protein Golob_014542 [Gossypium lobatum]|uniref:Uncharacterized protein n=1 Tax=Gossypium lobatum TaxID=34289 RepID=A0A7J8LYJ7_9ROSI|nr:hypothetical protein [Gossypium lobatum]
MMKPLKLLYCLRQWKKLGSYLLHCWTFFDAKIQN